MELWEILIDDVFPLNFTGWGGEIKMMMKKDFSDLRFQVFFSATRLERSWKRVASQWTAICLVKLTPLRLFFLLGKYSILIIRFIKMRAEGASKLRLSSARSSGKLIICLPTFPSLICNLFNEKWRFLPFRDPWEVKILQRESLVFSQKSSKGFDDRCRKVVFLENKLRRSEEFSSSWEDQRMPTEMKRKRRPAKKERWNSF